MKPIVGIVPLVDQQLNSLWMLPDYMAGIEKAGGLPLMLPLDGDGETVWQIAALCGGILFPGGQDVSPQLYGEEALPLCGQLCPERDAMEKALLLQALKSGKAVLGICRGLQLMNAALGGTLYQDLPTQRPSQVEHHQLPPYDNPVHPAALLPGTPLQALLGREQLMVNSYHHQAVKDLAAPMRPMALAPDGVIEALYIPQHPFAWAVQWHPELSEEVDPCSQWIFDAFVEACRGKDMDGRGRDARGRGKAPAHLRT